MGKKRHLRKALVLDNCTLLRNLSVKVPEELGYLEGAIKADFENLEAFYAKFLGLEAFTDGLEVVFFLQNRITKAGEFSSDGFMSEKSQIRIYSTVELYGEDRLGIVLAHEFAHFIDRKLGLLASSYSSSSKRKGTKENQLAEKFFSLQETKPVGCWFGGSSSEDLNSPVELYARYLEEFYVYCFNRKMFEARKDDSKNCTYVKKSEFEKYLLEDVSRYLDYIPGQVKEPSPAVEIDGNLYSADRKVFLKYREKEGEKNFTIPDFVEEIGKYAFDKNQNLQTIEIGKGVEKINSFAFRECRSLKKVTGGQNVRILASYAFPFCSHLEEIPDFENLEIIDSMAFSKCQALENLGKCDKLSYIGSLAFIKCRTINPQIFLEKVAYVDKTAFRGCKAEV